MKLLVLGGTSFVGRHMVERAIARGHDLTLFNRGRTHAELFPHAEKLVGDRDGGLGVLDGRTWDAVIDVSGYFPRLVKDSTDRLAERVGRYVFVSTISVYADFTRLGMEENAPLLTLADPTVEEITKDTYGGLKVLCEQAVTARYGDRALVVRPGIVAGPYDPTDRFTYWAVAMASGRPVVAPAPMDAPMQTIDARDLADFTIHMTEAGASGIYNAVGDRHSRADFLAALIPAGVESPVRWLDEAAIRAKDVEPGRFPYWTPEEARGILDVSAAKAKAAGLVIRPLAETAEAARAWFAGEGRSLQTGPSPEDVARLLEP